jgi:hypothetical protein
MAITTKKKTAEKRANEMKMLRNKATYLTE